MQLQNEEEFNRLLNLIDKKMTETFGNDIVKGKTWQVYGFMPSFEFNYDYLPLDYEICLFGERWTIFAWIKNKTIEKGYSQQQAFLQDIREHRVGLNDENVENIVHLLKEVLEKEDIEFLYYDLSSSIENRVYYFRNSKGFVRSEKFKEYHSKQKHIWEYER